MDGTASPLLPHQILLDSLNSFASMDKIVLVNSIDVCGEFPFWSHSPASCPTLTNSGVACIHATLCTSEALTDSASISRNLLR